MQYVTFKDLKLSRLMLGTVQFGLDYGVANRSGKPPYEKAREIIAAAVAGGVNCFDTAALYGDSEEVLGQAFTELGIQEQVTVVTKVTKPQEENLSASAARTWVESSLVSSLKKLRLEVLPVCLFHGEDQIRYIDVLREMQVRGLVRHIGASADTAGGADAILRAPGVEAMQLPLNIFDRRYEPGQILERAAKDKTALFARSVYLQGLLLMPEAEIKPVLQEQVVPVRRRLAGFAEANNMTMPELCMRYVLARPEITCVLTGVDSVAQLQENLELFAKGPLSPAQAAELAAMIPDFPESVVRPCLWPNSLNLK